MQELPDDAAHPPRHDGDGGVGLFATPPVLLVESAKVGRATDRHPARLDQSPAQPLIAKGQEPAVPGLATAGVGRWDNTGISA